MHDSTKTTYVIMIGLRSGDAVKRCTGPTFWHPSAQHGCCDVLEAAIGAEAPNSISAMPQQPSSNRRLQSRTCLCNGLASMGSYDAACKTTPQQRYCCMIVHVQCHVQMQWQVQMEWHECKLKYLLALHLPCEEQQECSKAANRVDC